MGGREQASIGVACVGRPTQLYIKMACPDDGEGTQQLVYELRLCFPSLSLSLSLFPSHSVLFSLLFTQSCFSPFHSVLFPVAVPLGFAPIAVPLGLAVSLGSTLLCCTTLCISVTP